MYATVEDLRAEGVPATFASDERLRAVLEEATSFIDSATGWFFEPRSMVFRLSGRGTPSIEPPVPPIRLERLTVNGEELDLDTVFVVGAPVQPGFGGPWITLRYGRVFPRGSGNVLATGLWGYTEPDGSPMGRTPLPIRRVAMELAMRWLPGIADGDAADARNRWRVVEERIRDQAIRFAPVTKVGPFTGDPELDAVLLRYRRPAGLGAV